MVKYGTFLLVFLTPILYFGAGWYIPYTTSKTFFFYGAVEIIFAVWLYQLFVDASYRLSKKDLMIFSPFLVYILWMTVAGIFGADPSMSFWSSLGRGTGLLTLYHVTALVFVIASLVKKYGLADYGYKLLAWFIGGASVLTISIWLGNEGFNLPLDFLLKSKGGGLMGNSSLAAAVLVFVFFLAVFLIAAKDISKKYKISLSVILALVVFSPLFINIFGNSISARGAALGICIGLLAFVPFYFALSKEKAKKYLGVALLAIGLAACIFSWQSMMVPGTKIHDKFSDSTGESRFLFWDIAKRAINESPILGYGPENYRVAYQKHFDPKIYTLSTNVETWNDRAHNIVFENGVAGGWPAIILYLAFLGSLLWGSFRLYAKEKVSKTQAATLGSFIAAYFIQNLLVFDSIVSLVALGILAGIIFGASATTAESVNEKPRKKANGPITTILIILIFIPTWVYFAWMPSRKANAFSEIIQMSLNKRPDHYVDLLKGSIVGNGSDVGAVAEDTYEVYSKNQESIKADEILLKYSIIDLQKFTEYLEIVAGEEQMDYRLRLNLARLYNIYYSLSLDKDKTLLQKALIREEEARALSPNDLQIYWTEAVTRFRLGDKTGAVELLEKAIEIAPYIDFSRDLLDQISG